LPFDRIVRTPTFYFKEIGLEQGLMLPGLNKTLAFSILVSMLFCLPANVDGQQNRRPRKPSVSKIKKTIKKLKPLATKLEDPKPGQWLDSHDEEGQTFSQYLRFRPNVLTEERYKLYVQPIGEFSEKQKELVTLSAEFLSIYFNCEVETLDVKDESEIPDSAKRIHPSWGDKQLLTGHILDEILAPELLDDAFAEIAFTTSDLWPGDGWNFVFGYASFRDRVGVWSLYRYGDPDESDESFQLALSRAIKVASHETGHMFSIKHCIKYQCNMQGSNSLPESDSQPQHLCPECHAKILFATRADPVERYRKLIEFCEKHGLEEEVEFYKAAKAKLE
jgi:archaemetzincin